jgi:hypothetical protein
MTCGPEVGFSIEKVDLAEINLNLIAGVRAGVESVMRIGDRAGFQPLLLLPIMDLGRCPISANLFIAIST